MANNLIFAVVCKKFYVVESGGDNLMDVGFKFNVSHYPATFKDYMLFCYWDIQDNKSHVQKTFITTKEDIILQNADTPLPEGERFPKVAFALPQLPIQNPCELKIRVCLDDKTFVSYPLIFLEAGSK